MRRKSLLQRIKAANGPISMDAVDGDALTWVTPGYAKDGDDNGGGGGSASDDEAAAAAAAEAAAKANADEEAAAQAKADEEAAAAAKADDGSSDDGKAKPSDAEVKLLRDLMKNKDGRRTAEGERDTLQSELSAIRNVLGDVSLEDVQALIDQRKDAETKQLEAKGEYERITEKMKEENTKRIDEMQERLDASDTKVSKLTAEIGELTIGRSFSESAFIRDRSALPASIARSTFEDHFDLVDGNIVAYDRPRGTAERTPIVDDQGNNKVFEDAIASIFEGHAESKTLLRSQAKAGSGSKTEDTAAARKAAEEKDTGTPKLSGVSRIQSALNAK